MRIGGAKRGCPAAGQCAWDEGSENEAYGVNVLDKLWESAQASTKVEG